MTVLHGLLLTGGTSLRMMADKATIPFGDSTLAARGARALLAVADPVLAVGHEAGTGLGTVDDPKQGPLVALVAGADALAARGATGPVLLLACDLPLITATVLEQIAAALGEHDAAVPVLDDRPQPLVACYAPRALEAARALVAEGARAMHELLARLDVTTPADLPNELLLDVDTPEDLEAARHATRGPSAG